MTIPFIVKSKPANKVEYFELTGMSDGAYVCLSLDGNGKLSESETVNLNYVYQNSESTGPGSINLKYTLNANQYGILNTADQSKPLTVACDTNTVALTIPLGMRTQLEKAQEDSVAQNWIFGTSNTIEGKLSYTAESTKEKVVKTLNKKDIKIYFVASKSCPAKQTVTCEFTTLTAKTCENSTEGGTYDCYCNTNNVCYLDDKGEVKIIRKPSTSTTSTTNAGSQTVSTPISINSNQGGSSSEGNLP